MNDVKNKILRVAFFLHDLRGGGVERISIHLANEMCRMGHIVDLVMVNRRGERSYFEAINPNISIFELKQRRTLTSPMGFRSYIKKMRPDIVISALTHINVSTLLATVKLNDKPYIFVVEHNHQLERQANGHVEGVGFAVRCAFKLAPYLYRRADTIGAVSTGVRDVISQTMGLSDQRISVLHNPVITPDPGCLPRAKKILPWLEGQSDPYVIGVGSLSHEKNFELLIRAFARVRAKRRLCLIIAGEGPKRKDLEKLAQQTGFADDILLPGYVESIYPLIREASLLASTSRWEGLPTVLIEAMRLGTSVVATDCPSGPAEILQNGMLGSLVPLDDVESLANAIEQTLNEPQTPTALQRRAADFAPSTTTRRYLDLYYAHPSHVFPEKHLSI